MRVSVLFGTRPETIKCSPFIIEGMKRDHDVKVLFTGQHQEMATPILDFFDIRVDANFEVMRPNQSLASMSSLMLELLESRSEFKETDALVVQGDTTSAYIGAYWAFLNKIPVIHLEAGLRTHNIFSPFPEEANRQLISKIASVHLAPTDKAYDELIKEGAGPHRYMIGNTGLDSLRMVSEKVTTNNLPLKIKNFIDDKPYILITSHRRESFGTGMMQIAGALKTLAQEMPETKFIFPVHANPNVREVMTKELADLSNLLLIDPMDYLSFVALMKHAKVIVTDSGGIQEEAPTLEVPVVVMRETTERMEGIDKGFSILAGTDPRKIYHSVKSFYQSGLQAQGPNPYGDGFSSKRAWDILEQIGVIA
ncbi:MAG TPA: UDP-N-acetylglucosamine 2-epimerase (non-hydrolyzing) [Bacteriovoracaceae bacterium]|nr:UDP-N-acetylglucosamine 2-epimerase (non-hydrolyzing) [Bacteriovoracaceae bacterium]